jgi:hypothetical protein
MITQPIVKALVLQEENTEEDFNPLFESLDLPDPSVIDSEDWTDLGVFKSGYLFKERDTLKGWRLRYATLDPDFLHYFINREDVSPRKSMQIDASVIVTLDSSTAMTATDSSGNSLFPFTIQHPGSSLSFRLAARTLHESASWVKWLHAVIKRHRRQEEERVVTIRKEKGNNSSHTATNIAAESEESSKNPLLENLSSSQRRDVEYAVESVLSYTVNSTHHWSLLYDTNGITATRTSDKNGNSIIRGESILPYTITELFGVLSRAPNRKVLDPMIESYDRKKWFNLHTGIEYVKYYPKWPASSRDFCNLTHWRLLPNNLFLMVGMSVSDESCPAVRSSHEDIVRAKLFFGGYLMQPLPSPPGGGAGGTKVFIIVRSDLGGSIPKSIVEFASRKQPMAIASVREFLNQKYLNQQRHSQPQDHDQLLQQLVLIARENVGNEAFSRPPVPPPQLLDSVVGVSPIAFNHHLLLL